MRPFALGLALAALAAAAPAHAQLLSPGPLSQAHADLEGDSHCGDCHASGRGISNTACYECHDDIGARVRGQRGLHGREYQGRSCGECHVEHVGRSTRLIRWPGGQEHFDHTLTGYALSGAHATVECARCHHARNSRGASTFLGASTECRGCHEDPHESRLGNDCTSCHSTAAWTRVRLESLDHDRTRFPLQGTHERVACAGCHGNPPRYRGIEFAQCTACHSDPHAGRFGTSCTDCHDESSWLHVGDAFRNRHPGLSLAAGHSSVSCESCHDQGRDQAPSRGNECVDCHHNTHDAPLGRDCSDCHGGIRWTGLGRRIGLRAHERVREFPLRGMHADADCDGCHDPSLGAEARYRQLVFDRCQVCHEDRHEGEFATRSGGECAGCHDERGFRPTTFGVQAHSLTAFALTGRHEAVPCAGCHETHGEGNAREARIHFRVARQACADCHENPHGDQFATEMADGGCAHCHEAAGWDRPHIDHSIFPLEGAHAEAACESCHTVTPEDRAQLRGASYRGLPHECSGCHEDRHAGQFRLSEPVRGCNECHDATSFAVASFDHAARAHWPLEGRHAAVACAECHAETELRNGLRVVRYRLGYRRCADCHADPHEAAASSGVTVAPRARARDASVEPPGDAEAPTPPAEGAPDAPDEPASPPAPPEVPAAPPPEAPPSEALPETPAPEAPTTHRRRTRAHRTRSRSRGEPHR